MDVTLRKMAEGDIDILAPMMKRAFDRDSQMHLGRDGGPDGYDDGTFLRKWGLDPGVTPFCVLADGEIAGCIFVWIHPNGENYLGCIFIDDCLEEKGIGVRAWKLVEDMYPETSVWSVDTPSFTRRNHNFYINKLGFHLVRIDDPKAEVSSYFMRKQMHPKGAILLLGAVESEVSGVIERLPGGRWEDRGAFKYYIAPLNGGRVIVSKTGVGIINASVAATAAISAFSPAAVINIGTAGGHTRDMRPGDIVLGESCVYINNAHSPAKAAGEGSNALEWQPGKSGTFVLDGDTALLEKAASVAWDGRVIKGRLGSGDMFSREIDRIDLMHSQMGEICEDMESAAVYKACALLQTPCIGVRIIGNNELTDDKYVSGALDKYKEPLAEYVFSYLNVLTGGNA